MSQVKIRKESKYYKYAIFVFLFCIYVGLHASRTCWSYIQHDVNEDLNYSEESLGVIDMVFLFAYSFGLFLSGNIADRTDRSRLYAMGLFVSALCFGFVGYAGLVQFSYEWVFIVVFGLMGLAQSTVYLETFPKTN
mgnify:FL=1